MSPAPQQSSIQCFQTLDLCKMKPPHTTATELAFLPDMFDQRMFTSFLQQKALLVTNYRDNEQTRQTTGQHDNPLGPLLLRHREVRTDQQRVNSHNPVSMIVRRNQSHRDSQTDLTRRDCSVIHPPLMPADGRTRQHKLHLRSTLQITRVDSNSNSHARRHFTQCISRNHRSYPGS